jgi:SAM-dependent methyltransferase
MRLSDLIRRGRPTAHGGGTVEFGDLGRLTPISTDFGDDRGLPIDRYYIHEFLNRHAGALDYAPSAVTGRVLEIGDATYARRYANPEFLESVDVLDASPTNPNATVIGDLADGTGLTPDSYDCVICTQTLLLIYEVRSAIRTLHEILRPGGSALVTVPGISQICRIDMEAWGDHWRFTSTLMRRLFEEHFAPENVTVEAYGNVLSATSFLQGLAAEDLRSDELDVRDPRYELIIAVKATK